MATRAVLVRGDTRLRKKASKVRAIDSEVLLLLDDMVETMRAEDGVGLAAPQIGVGLRVFVMEIEGLVYEVINPEIIRTTGEVVHGEGCLSVPGYMGQTRRAARVSIKGLDRAGKPIRIAGEGLLAKCIQHEMDHLDGVLYLTRLTSPENFRRVEVEQEPEIEANETEGGGRGLGT